MKKAEESAFDVISPMITGQSWARLPHDHQTRIATLATIVATMADLDDPATSGVSKAEREFIRTNLSPPPHWHIGLGRVDGGDWTTRWLHHGLRLGPRSDIGCVGECNTHITTIGMGQVLLQVFSVPREAVTLDSERFFHDIGLVRIFPTGQAVEAGALRVHDNAGAEQIASVLFLNLFSNFGGRG